MQQESEKAKEKLTPPAPPTLKAMATVSSEEKKERRICREREEREIVWREEKEKTLAGEKWLKIFFMCKENKISKRKKKVYILIAFPEER